MARIEIQSEEESGRGWVYRAAVEHAGQRTQHAVTLAWVDHDRWSGGRVPPSTVIEALIGFVLEQGRAIPERFDAATVRRWFPDVDRELAGRF